ncbi:MAG: IclR family transcriptional regulator, partial [Pseudomonadota bacterium]
MTADESDRNGSLVTQKTCSIIREVSRHGSLGVRLQDIAISTNIARPTVHRILSTLVKERFIKQNQAKRYVLGAELFEIGTIAPSPIQNIAPLRRLIQDLADQTGDTTYLAIRRAERAFYILRCEGEFPIRTHYVEAGHSVPLVGSHCGHALLSAMPVKKAEEIIRRSELTPGMFGAGNAESLRNELAEFRAHGFCWATNVTFKGVAGIAAPILDRAGQGHLAISISTISARLDRRRAAQIAKPLLATAEKIRAIV